MEFDFLQASFHIDVEGPKGWFLVKRLNMILSPVTYHPQIVRIILSFDMVKLVDRGTRN